MTGLCGLVRYDDGPVDPTLLRTMASAAPHRFATGAWSFTRDQAALVRSGHGFHDGLPDRHMGVPATFGDGNVRIVAGPVDDFERDAQLPIETSSSSGGGGHAVENVTTWLKRLRGEFVAAAWSPATRCVSLARDVMGMRPLFYRAESNRILFASEVKQLLAVPGIDGGLDEETVGAHLGGRPVPPGRTFYDGISELPPGMILHAGPAGMRLERFQEIDWTARITYRAEQDYVDHFRDLFQECVQCRLRDASNPGILLSGGVDSGSVASMVGSLIRRGELNCRLRSYSWEFESLLHCDERAISDLIVAEFGFIPTPVAAERIALLGGGVPDRDEPTSLVYETLLRSTLDRAVVDGCDVVLSGFRGDCIVGGWIFDYWSLLRRGLWLTAWREIRAHRDLNDVSLGSIVRLYLARPARHRLASRLGRCAHRRTSRAQPPAWVRGSRFPALRAPEQTAPCLACQAGDFARAERHHAIFWPMHARTAVTLERLHAQAGVEHADPWSDERMMRFALAVPARALASAGRNKRIATQAMSGTMPEAALARVGKRSPEALMHRCLRERETIRVRELISCPRSADLGFVDPVALSRYFERYLAGAEEDPRFWYTLSLENWLRHHWN